MTVSMAWGSPRAGARRERKVIKWYGIGFDLEDRKAR